MRETLLVDSGDIGVDKVSIVAGFKYLSIMLHRVEMSEVNPPGYILYLLQRYATPEQ